MLIAAFLFLCPADSGAQVKSKVDIVGGDNVPILKKQFETTLETVLLQVNRVARKAGTLDTLRPLFSQDAFPIFEQFVLQNHAQTARKMYNPQMIERQRGTVFDIRSITLRIDLGGTEASDNQNIIFSFSSSGQIIAVRSMLPNYDYQSVIARGDSPEDSSMWAFILDFMEQFRMAYNSKDTSYLDKVYSDDALIIVGTVLQEKKNPDDVKVHSLLSEPKVKFIQQTKKEYIDALRRVFKRNSFVNVRFEDFKIIRHEKIRYLYGVSCWQAWNTPTYSDKGFLFLMVDFRNIKEPIIHVRSWQPKAFEEDGGFVNLYDFDVVQY
jgi:hypothetical protein